MKLLKVMVVCGAALALTGCAAAAPHPTPKPKLSASGSISVPIDASALMTGATDNTEGSPCTSTAGYDDIAGGTQVVITDATGKTVAVGVHESGALKAGPDATAFDARCDFPFTVTGIPAGSKFYGVHIGNTNRGVQQERPDQLKSIALTIG
jgi:hypothetical protein